MSAITLYGPAYSVYTRIVRLVLEEKHQPYVLEEVDFISSGMPGEQKVRHPFGMVPALAHAGEVLVETAAIASYLDDVFPDPPLRPATPAARAHMVASISLLDHYLWPDIRELVTQSVFAGLVGGWPDDSIKERMVKRLSDTLPLIEQRFLNRDDLQREQIMLVDLHALPMIAYLAMCVEGQVLLGQCKQLQSWYERLKDRPSMEVTFFDLSTYPWARRGGD